MILETFSLEVKRTGPVALFHFFPTCEYNSKEEVSHNNMSCDSSGVWCG